jgi:2-C-methyl-D-erythritol 4-phosphate cytidylyltransferase
MGEGIKKEYRLLSGGLTVLGKAVSAFAAVPEIQSIVITFPADTGKADTGEAATGEAGARNALPPRLLAENAVPRVYFVAGGATRQASVFNALSLLSALPAPPGYALIHDGARPFVSASLIANIIAEVKIHRAVIPLLPLTETPKETDTPLEGAGGPVFIKQHLRRAFTGAAQTPQAFAFPEIFAAHKKAMSKATLPKSRFEYTDDAEVWAAFCGPVAAVPGEIENRKITFPEDLV